MSWLQFFSTPTPAELAKRKRAELRRLATRPSVGATIYCADLRMSVQVGLSSALWRWLVERGWRELQDPSLRVKLRALPSSAVSALYEADPSTWEGLLAGAIRQVMGKAAAQGARVAA